MSSPPPSSLGGLLRHLGPGFIITATIVGSGELTHITAARVPAEDE